MTAGAGGCSRFALVSSVPRLRDFSGAWSGDVILIVCHSERSEAQSRNPAAIPEVPQRDVSTLLDMTRTTFHKILSHRGHASSKSRRAKIFPRFGPAVPIPRLPCSTRHVPRIATARREMAQNRFPKSFHNLRPREIPPLSLLRNEQPRSPSERWVGVPTALRSFVSGNRDPGQAEYLIPPGPPVRHGNRAATAPAAR